MLRFNNQDIDKIKQAALEAIWIAQDAIRGIVAHSPERAFQSIDLFERGTQKNKRALVVDVTAESNTVNYLLDKLPTSFRTKVYGEEGLLKEPNLTSDDSLVVLLDMVDGTDLLERNLGNWCSAMVFFHPISKEILAAFVGLTDQLLCRRGDITYADVIYFWTQNEPGVQKVVRSSAALKLNNQNSVPSFAPTEIAFEGITGPRQDDKDLTHASLCFYGQKVTSFLQSNIYFRALCKSLEELARVYARNSSVNESQQKKLPLRIYTLAGNPMMMKLIDPYEGSASINVVFDFEGQAPHDMVPGVFLAAKAGAILRTPENEPITDEDLATALLRPASRDSRLRYFLACNEFIANEFAQLLVHSDTEVASPTKP